MNIIIIIISFLTAFFLSHNAIINSDKIGFNLCKDKYQDCSAEEVITCEYDGDKIYRVSYNCEDLPNRYFDSKGKLISDECGGMPRVNDSGSLDDLCFKLGKNCDFDKNLCLFTKQK